MPSSSFFLAVAFGTCSCLELSAAAQIIHATTSAEVITVAPDFVFPREAQMCPPDVVDFRSYEDESGYICRPIWPESYCPNPYTSGDICWSSWTNFASSFLGTAFNTPTFRFWNTSTRVSNTASPSSCTLVDASGNEVSVTSFTWTASRGPCCLDCSIGGGTVQLMVWPTPAPTPAISLLVEESSNFTFTSPSIYAVFESLFAVDQCGPVGTTIYNTTLAFPPQILSTATDFFDCDPPPGSDAGEYCEYSYIPGYNWTEVNLIDMQPSNCEWHPNDPWPCYQWNPCSPLLSVPTQIFDLNPLWKTCSTRLSAFFDPPYFLTPMNGLIAVTSTSSVSSQTLHSPTSNSPAPAASPVPATAISTSPPSPTNDPPVVDPPASVNGNTVVGNVPATVIPSDRPSGDAASPTPDPSPANVASPGPVSTSPGADPPLPGGTDPIQGTTMDPYIIGSQTLVAGGSAITVSGTVISLDPDGQSVVIGGTTKLATAALGAYSHVSPVLAISTYIIGSQTLIAGGPAITVSGEAISLDPAGQSVVIGGATKPATAVLGIYTATGGSETTSEMGLGAVIMTIGGFVQDPPEASTTSSTTGFNGLVFTGGSSGSRADARYVWITGMVVLAFLPSVGAL